LPRDATIARITEVAEQRMTTRERDPPQRQLQWWRFRHPLDRIRDIAGVPIGVWTIWTLVASSAPLALNVLSFCSPWSQHSPPSFSSSALAR